MLRNVRSSSERILVGSGINPISPTEKVVKYPKSTPTKTCRKCLILKSFPNSINSIKAQLDMRMFVRISEDRNSGMAKEQFLCHTRACRRTATYIFRVIRPRCWFCINAPPGLSESFCPYLSAYMPICALTSPNQTPLEV